MIARLRGTLVDVQAEHVVIDAGGVGYQVFCTLRAGATLHESLGQDVILHVHTSVSDDAIRLYGFRSHDELRLFQLLIGVERIGPKAALGILGRAELPVMVRAIRGGDAALVATVPGIGPKTAERVILELRDKLDGLFDEVAPAPQRGERRAADAAVEGLVGLGFREHEAREAVNVALRGAEHEPEVAELVGKALRNLDLAGAAR
ncbi:MAG TPA: Holliday junction branch migration protein RuvA [Candidatus Dormibacteraeota bacterium]|nr:Holliday junction branch migration protein RuvA [Candidatus Dormibacteraeota bacterium]